MNRRLVAIVLGVLAVAAVVYGLVQVVPMVRHAFALRRHLREAAAREPAAEAAWRSEFGDPAESLAAFPARDEDATARELVTRARALGIDMAAGRKGGVSRDEELAVRAAMEPLSDYFEFELGRTGGPVGAPGGAARTCLETIECEVDAVVDLLADGTAPVWRQDVSKGPEAPVPNLLGEIRLQRILVARSLQLAALGRAAGVDRAFAASWTLNGSLRDRADLISQIIAMSVARMQAGLARRISLPSASVASWRERLSGHDFRESVLRALRLESLAYARSLSPGKSLFDRASRVDYLDVRRMMLVRLRDTPVSDGPLRIAEPSDLTDPPLSGGAILATLAVPNLLNTVRRADRLIVDLELTDRVLQARDLRAKLGHWPDRIPDIERSRIADGHWVYSSDGKNGMSIAFSRDLLWDGLTGVVLPLRYESDDWAVRPPRATGSAGRE